MSASSIAITLSGGPHLTEFSSFSAKAVRWFDSRKSGGRCLRGPFVRVHGDRVPLMNTQTEYALPAAAACLYIYGRSSHGPGDDVHAALVHEPGSQVVLPLTVATDEKRRDVARLASLLEHAKFIFARTMPQNPHEYTRRTDWASAADFEFAVRAIRRYGHREKYIPPGAVKAAYTETVFASGAHFVWSGWQPPEITGWINRKPLPAPVEARVVDQSLGVEHARLLEIPDLPDGFAGLDTTITRCRHFRVGCHLFGYVTPT